MDPNEPKKGFRPEDDEWLKSQYEKDQPPLPRVVPPPDERSKELTAGQGDLVEFRDEDLKAVAEQEARRRAGLPVYQEPGTKEPTPRVDKEVGDRHFTPDGRVMTSDEVRRMTMTPTERVNREQQMRRLTRQEQQEALEGMDLSEYEE